MEEKGSISKNKDRGKKVVVSEKEDKKKDDSEKKTENQAGKSDVKEINDMLTCERAAKKAPSISTDALKRFAWLDHIDIGIGIQSTDEWEDTNLLALEHLDISGYQKYSPEDQLKIMRIGLKPIYCEVTSMSVGTLLACAWLLKSPENDAEYIFKEPDMTGASSSIDVLPRHILESEEEKPGELEVRDVQKFLKEGAYVCAAMLRSVTKEPNNIKNAWRSIKGSYANFYKKGMSISIEPSLKCLEALRNILQNRTIVRNTVSLFLLNIKHLEGQDLRICKMLFEIHMSYTGMHSYKLLISCATTLNVPLRTMCRILRHPRHRDALLTIEKLFTEYDFPEAPEDIAKSSNRVTWKYARIFDSKAFATLQTKNCEQLTAILAILAKKIGVANSGDVTKIRQIMNLVDAKQEWFDGIACKIIEYCRKAEWANEEDTSGIFRN